MRHYFGRTPLPGAALTLTLGALLTGAANAATPAISLTLDGKPAILSDDPCTTPSPQPLPDILISEEQPGTLGASQLLALAAPYSSFSRFDLSQAKLTVTRRDNGGDVGTIFMTPGSLQTDTSPTTDNIPDFTFRLALPSNSSTGPLQLRLSGLRAMPNTDYGPLYLSIGHSAVSGSALQQLGQVKNFDGSDQPAQRLEVASFNALTWPAMSTRTCGILDELSNGPITARTVTVPAMPRSPSEQPYAFYPFIAAIHEGRIHAMDSQRQWHPISTCQDFPPALPLQPQGTLTTPAIPVLTTPTDLSSLAGMQLVEGWGHVSDPAHPGVQAACEDMVTHYRYIVIYTNH